MYHTKPKSFPLLFAENPCKVSFQTSKIYLNESDMAVFTCSTASSSCGKRPNITGLPTHARLNRDSSTSTVATLTVVSTDHQTVLSCGVPGLINECVRQNITLTVQCKSSNITRSSIHDSSCWLTRHMTLTVDYNSSIHPSPRLQWHASSIHPANQLYEFARTGAFCIIWLYLWWL